MRRRFYKGEFAPPKSRFGRSDVPLAPGMAQVLWDAPNSALRRNVAAHLGIASAADIKARRYFPTRPDADRVNATVRSCRAAWIECSSEK